MKLRVLVTLSLVGLAGAVVSPPSSAHPAHLLAKPKKAKPKADKASGGQMKKRIALTPRGMAWSINLEQIAKIYDKVFDDEFVPLYKKVQPGPRMAALDAELANKKQLIRRNKIAFGRLPTGVDQTPLKGEYSYNNGESMSKVPLRTGTVRYFFFFNDRLWKVYDEHKLRKGGPLGENFKEAVEILSKKFGVGPKSVPVDYDKGQNFEEAHWFTSDTVIRAIDRGGPVLAMVYVDRKIQENLRSYRKNRAEDPNAIDPDVARVTKPDPPPPPPEDDKGKKKKKK